MSIHNFRHFTGKKGSSKTKPKTRMTKKQKRTERKNHKNKYKSLAEPREGVYSHKDKRLRQLPLPGKTGEIIKAGLIVLFHKRRYRLKQDTKLEFPGMLALFELDNI